MLRGESAQGRELGMRREGKALGEGRIRLRRVAGYGVKVRGRRGKNGKIAAKTNYSYFQISLFSEDSVVSPFRILSNCDLSP